MHVLDWLRLAAVAAAAAILLTTSPAPATAPPPSLAKPVAALRAAPSTKTLPTTTDPPVQQVWTGVDTVELNGQKGCGNVGGDSANISSEVPCTFGDRTATRSVVVVGDSMAGAWIPAFDLWGQAQHWKVVRLVKDGCPPWTTHVTAPQCLAFRAFEVRTINTLRPNAVFAVGLQDRGQVTMETTKPSLVAATIEGFAKELRPSRAKVLVPQNTPWFFGIGSPLDCLVANAADVRTCNRDARAKVVEAAMLHGIGIATADHFVTAVPVDQLFCTTTICPVLVGNHIVYADDHHFSTVWAEYVSTALGTILDPRV